MQHDARKLLWDARDALDAVEAFIEGHSHDDFLEDRLLRSAIERQFEIAGEALAKLAKLDPEMARRIPDLPRIIAFRNVLIHAYADVDPDLVWRIAKEHLPSLRSRLDELLPPDSNS